METNQCVELRVNVLDFLDELCPVVVSLYERLRDYELSGIEVLGDVAEGLKSLIVAATSLNNDLNLGIEDEINSLATQLKEISDAVENADYLFLSDILEFDLVETMEKIYNAVRDA